MTTKEAEAVVEVLAQVMSANLDHINKNLITKSQHVKKHNPAQSAHNSTPEQHTPSTKQLNKKAQDYCKQNVLRKCLFICI